MADPPGHVPLTPLDLSILLVVSRGPSYGYGIMKAVAEQAHGGIELAPGNIYQALDRLISRGWIAETDAPAGSTAERRRYYRITADGVRAAAAEAERLQQMQEALRRVLARRLTES